MKGGFDSTMASLGSRRRKAPGTRDLTRAQYPGVSSLDGNPPPISDHSSLGETTIAGSLITLPHRIRFAEGSPDDLLKRGDLLFCGKGATNDPRVSVFELAHVNELLRHAYEEFKKTLEEPVSALMAKLGRNATSGEEQLPSFGSSSSSRSFRSGYTLEDKKLKDWLIEAADRPNGYNPKAYNQEKTNGILAGGFFPSDLEIFLLNPNVPQEQKNKFLIDADDVDDPSEDEDVDPRVLLRKKIRMIVAGNPNVFNYVSREGIMSKFNFMGPLLYGPQEDIEADKADRRGQSRNINVVWQGPCKVFNRWGDKMARGTKLFLILKRRPNSDGTFGEFCFLPYYSKRKDMHVPHHELEYVEVCGKKSLGEAFFVGSTQYPVNSQCPTKSRIASWGIREDINGSFSKAVGLNQAYMEKAKVDTIDILCNI